MLVVYLAALWQLLVNTVYTRQTVGTVKFAQARR